MKLPWDIIDAKSSHADRGVWTYPLKKTLPKATQKSSSGSGNHLTRDCWELGSPSSLDSGTGEGDEAVCSCLRRKKLKS